MLHHVVTTKAFKAMRVPAAKHQKTVERALGLLRTGHHVDGARALRRVLDEAPGNAAVASALAQVSAQARTWLMAGQNGRALELLAPLAASRHASGDILMLDGHALAALGRKDEAVAVFRRRVRAEPGNRDAVLRLAAVLADAAKDAEAEALVRGDVARHGDSPEAAFVLGRALLGLARYDEAEDEFRSVVRARPEHQQAQANLMELVWMRTGSVDAASRAIDTVLRGHPRLSGLRIARARLLLAARSPHDALDEIDAGLALAGHDPALLRAAATIALEFDGARALEYARRLLAVRPDDAVGRVTLGNASLAIGRPRAALEVAESLCRANPAAGEALALKADALRMLGDPRCRELLDYPNLVRAAPLDVPPGWPDLGAYLAELTGNLEHLHTLHAHPIDNSLRGGSQVRLVPSESAFASIRAFPQAIDRPIRHYIEALGHGPDPVRHRNTGRYRLSGMWSVRLRPDGFHVNHYHPRGWLSSACYLHLPLAVNDNGREGWLKFGQPAFPTTPALEPEHFIKPEPGLLVLFPACMWHGTMPFPGTGNDSRLTIAFDVVPAT